MSKGGNTGSKTNYNTNSVVNQTNTNEQRNNIKTTTNTHHGDLVDNRNSMKITVAGNVGDGTKVYLLNLDDITEVQLPNGQTAFLI